MKLTVHIGTTKTGSSSIQSFTRLNKAALKERGILIPSSLGREIHLNAVLASLPYGESRDLARTIPIVSAEHHAEFRASVVSAFRQEVADAVDCTETVITAEQLHSRMPNREDIAHFRELFCQGFSDVRIVVYVRPQLDQIVSLYSTMLRGGYADPIDDFLQSRMRPAFRSYFSLQDIIERWSAVFGAAHVLVRPYKAISHKNGCLGDFAGLLGIDLDEGHWNLEGKANASINMAGQELLLLLNQTEALSAEQRRKVVRWAERNCSGPGAAPSLAMAQRFVKPYLDSNEWVIKTYFPDHPEYLEPRWPAE